MIDLSHICKTYVMGEETIKAMDDVSLHIYPQEYVSVVGPSGSGKSTLMHILGCLDRADAGRYLLEGQDVILCSPGELSRIRSRRIGFVFQQFYLLPQMTAYEAPAVSTCAGGGTPGKGQPCAGKGGSGQPHGAPAGSAFRGTAAAGGHCQSTGHGAGADPGG